MVQWIPPPSTKYTPLAGDKAFLASIEALGLAQGDNDMTVDAGASTAHAGSLDELAKAQEAYGDISAKFGPESPMAKVLLNQLETLQKQLRL